jgi:opacity protein-like surface antigen
MKKALLLVIAASLMAASSFAAVAAKKKAAASKVEIGVKGIIGMTNVGGSAMDGVTHAMQLGFGGGLFAQIKAGKTLMIQPELGFVTGGTKITEGGVDVHINTSAIELPVLIKAVFGDEKSKIKPAVFVGPAIAMIMSAKEKVTGEPAVDIKDQINTTNLSLVGGVGLEASKLVVDLRYELGLSNLAKDAPSGIAMKSSAILLGIGYKLN